MSTIGSSAAGLVAVVGVLKNFAGSGPLPPLPTGQGPSGNSVPPNESTVLPRAQAVGSDDGDRWAGNGMPFFPNLDGRGANESDDRRRPAYDAEQHLQEQSRRISDLVDRFQKAVVRIREYLGEDDATRPLDPRDVGRRMSSALVANASHNLSTGSPRETAAVNPSTWEARHNKFAPSRDPLDIVA